MKREERCVLSGIESDREVPYSDVENMKKGEVSR
jgi:hypothetical protein